MSQEIIDNLNAEKIALDQTLVKTIQEVLELRKQLLLKDKAINDVNAQMQVLLREKEELQLKEPSIEMLPEIIPDNGQ